MKIEKVPVDGVEVGARHRRLNQAKVDALAASMASEGLLNPITVYEPSDGFVGLVAGAHRLAAARQLGWEWIESIFIVGDEIDREIAEIDENLCRAELTEAEEAAHLKRRKELWEARQQRAAGDKLAHVAPVSGGRGNKGFAAETATITGLSKSQTNRKIARAEKIAGDVLEEVKGTDLDKGVVLDTLKKLDHEEQRQAVDRVKSGASKTVDDAYEFIRGEAPKPKPKAPTRAPSKKNKLMAAWKAANSEDRAEFLDDPEVRAAFLARIDFGQTKPGEAA